MKVSSQDNRRSKEDALAVIRHCTSNGIVQFIPHCHQRCAERGIDIQDVLYLLNHGIIQLEPELDVKRGQWRYKVEGRTSEGKNLAVIVAFEDEETTIVITVISL